MVGPRLVVLASIFLLAMPVTALQVPQVDLLPETAPDAGPEPTPAPHTAPAEQATMRLAAPSVQTQDAPVASPVMPGRAMTVQEALQEAADVARIDLDHPFAPKGLRNLALQPNETLNATGDDTHRHGVNDRGLGPIWTTTFQGVPHILVRADITGDGSQEVLAGTDVGITVTTATGDALWNHPIGSTVSALFAIDGDGDGAPEVGFATRWGGQTARVGLLDGDGTVLWEHLGDGTFLSAGPTGDGDILAIDIRGNHLRLSGMDGSIVNSLNVDLLPSTYVPSVAYYYNQGHYLAAVGDVNGDGIADSISASLHDLNSYTSAPFVYATRVDWMFTLVHAVDGATGQSLWVHQIASEPGDIIQWQFLTDLVLVDARGDGSLDVAVSGYGFTYRWTAFMAPSVIQYDTFYRILDGDSTAVAGIVGARYVRSPTLTIDVFLDLEPTDVDGDGVGELSLLHSSVLGGVTAGTTQTVERFSSLGNTAQPTMMAVSDVVHPVEAEALLIPLENGDIAISAFDYLQGTLEVLAADGTVSPQRVAPGSFILDMDRTAGTVLATLEGLVEVPAVDAAPAWMTPLHGAALDLMDADRDGDGHPDLIVHASDGNLHTVDGLSGHIIETLDLEGLILDARLSNVDGNGTLDFVITTIALQDGYPRYRTEARSGDDLEILWATSAMPMPGPWFDGNGDGALDFLADWDTFDRTLSAIDGATGDTLWSEAVEVPGNPYLWFYWGAESIVSINGDDDLVLHDNEWVLAIDGKDGSTLWAHDLGDYAYNGCMAGADLDGDGRDTVYGIFDAFPDPISLSISPAGDVAEWDVLRHEDVYNCDVRTVRGHDGQADSLAVSYLFWLDGYRHIAGRSDGGKMVWYDETDLMGNSGVSSILGFSDGLLYTAHQDHANAFDWTTGDPVAEFTADGPFIQGGRLIDLDSQGERELVVHSRDGRIWAVSQDPDAVGANLAAAAVQQGKAAPEGFAPATDPTEGAPGLPLALLLVGLLGLTAWRRSGKR